MGIVIQRLCATAVAFSFFVSLSPTLRGKMVTSLVNDVRECANCRVKDVSITHLKTTAGAESLYNFGSFCFIS